MTNKATIKLVLSDVDGTLLTNSHQLTDRALAAVHALRSAGIRFAITSGRPPDGLQMLYKPLALDTPVAAFNGGMIVEVDRSVCLRWPLTREVVRQSLREIQKYGLSPWLYSSRDWLLTRVDAPHVRREADTVRFEPTVTRDFSAVMDDVIKVVGVNDDIDAVAACEDALQQAIGQSASVSRSQPYYVDITHRRANKGAVVHYLADRFGIALESIATIGDGPNDIQRFKQSGTSIAMGNADEGVKAAATHTTESNKEDGFANAIEQYVIGQRTGVS